METPFNKKSPFERQMLFANLKIVAWIFAWTAACTLTDKAVLHGWFSADWQPLAAIAVSTAVGLGMIFNFVRFLHSLDDLQRKIQMDALAIALGVTVVGSFTYSLLVTAGIIVDEEVSDIFMLTVLSYSAAAMLGTVRYR